MTVGIGAICRAENGPQVVISADRMVTVGAGSGIEYEDTDSKIEVVTETDGMVCVAVGSGSLNYIDEVLDRLEDKMIDNPPTDVGGVVSLAGEAFREMERDTINRNILSQYGLSIEELSDSNSAIPAQFQGDILEKIDGVRSTLRDSVNIMLGGVSNGEAELHAGSNDYNSFTSTGYSTIGSGSQSAQLSFIRNRYDPDHATLPEATFTVAEAKVQAEERQGVGQEMDMITVSNDGVEKIEEIETLRDLVERAETQQQQVRERVIETWGE